MHNVLFYSNEHVLFFFSKADGFYVLYVTLKEVCEQT